MSEAPAKLDRQSLLQYQLQLTRRALALDALTLVLVFGGIWLVEHWFPLRIGLKVILCFVAVYSFVANAIRILSLRRRLRILERTALSDKPRQADEQCRPHC